jgi:hypothetical protein
VASVSFSEGFPSTLADCWATIVSGSILYILDTSDFVYSFFFFFFLIFFLLLDRIIYIVLIIIFTSVGTHTLHV